MAIVNGQATGLSDALPRLGFGESATDERNTLCTSAGWIRLLSKVNGMLARQLLKEFHHPGQLVQPAVGQGWYGLFFISEIVHVQAKLTLGLLLCLLAPKSKQGQRLIHHSCSILLRDRHRRQSHCILGINHVHPNLLFSL